MFSSSAPFFYCLKIGLTVYIFLCYSFNIVYLEQTIVLCFRILVDKGVGGELSDSALGCQNISAITCWQKEGSGRP